MKTWLEKRNGKYVQVYSIEDFDRDVAQLVEILKARKYRTPIKILVES